MEALAQSVGGPSVKSVEDVSVRQSTSLQSHHTCAGQGDSHQNTRLFTTTNGRTAYIGCESVVMTCPINNQRMFLSPRVPYLIHTSNPRSSPTPHTNYANTIMYGNDTALFQRPYLGRSWSDWDAMKWHERRK